MDATTYADPEVIVKVNEDFIAVRVDNDERPDINARYNMGGWPTTAFLTSRGRIMAGGTYIPRDLFLEVLDQISAFYRENLDRVESPSFRGVAHPVLEREVAAQDTVRGELTRGFIEAVTESAEDEYDSRFGGFGRGAKFPQVDTLLLLLSSGAWGLKDRTSMVTRTLKTMYAGEIHDKIEEGFFRYATQRDWSKPHYEKMLEDNARLMECFLVAHARSGLSEFATGAHEIASYLDTVLWMPDRGFYAGSQQANEEYYVEGVEGRRRRVTPPVDRTVYSDWNAMAAVSLLSLAWQTGNSRYADRALLVVRNLTEKMLDPSGSCYHYWREGQSPEVSGLLSDQAHLGLALAESYEYTQEKHYLDLIRSLIRFCEKNLTAPSQAFYDRTAPEHEMLEKRVPLDENAVMARAYMRAATLLDETSYRDRAESLLEALVPQTAGGLESSAAALSVGIYLRPVAVLTGSCHAELSSMVKTRFWPGLVLNYDKTLENRALVCAGDKCFAPVVGRQEIKADIAEATSPRDGSSRVPGYTTAEFIHPQVER
jgi:hypothetical protein